MAANKNTKSKGTGGGGGGGTWDASEKVSISKTDTAALDKARAEVQGAIPRTATGGLDVTTFFGTDFAKTIESVFGSVPSGGYTAQTIDPNKIKALYEANPLASTQGLQEQLASQRTQALEAQLAALDSRYQSTIGQVNSAYGAVNQLLGAAQQDFTKGYNPIVASQAGVNAETQAAMQQAQAEVAARLASTGTSSVGGAQSAAVGSAVANQAAQSGQAQSDLLIGQGGAMQSYMTGMAPQLAALAQAGALKGLGSARINAEAQARAQAAQASLEDMRALALQDIQTKNQRAESMIGALSNVYGTNVSIQNQAAAANAQAKQSLAMAKANLKATLILNQSKLLPQAEWAFTDLDNNVSKFVEASGGRGAAAVFNESADGKPLKDNERLMDANGNIIYDNFNKWSTATNRDESYLMTYLAAARARGLVSSPDFETAINTVAKIQANAYFGKDAKVDYTPANKAAAAERDKLYDQNVKKLTARWGSYGMFPDDSGMNNAMSQYLNESMASAFRSYTPPAKTGGSEDTGRQSAIDTLWKRIGAAGAPVWSGVASPWLR